MSTRRVEINSDSHNFHGIRLLALALAIVFSTMLAVPALASPLDQPDVPTIGKDDGLTFSSSGQARLVWQDNSSDEQGFRIQVLFNNSGERHDFSAPANSTEFVFPSSVRFQLNAADCQERAVVTVTVRAYNTSGDSAPASIVVERECGELPGKLPNTGGPEGMITLGLITGALLLTLGVSIRRSRGLG